MNNFDCMRKDCDVLGEIEFPFLPNCNQREEVTSWSLVACREETLK